MTDEKKKINMKIINFIIEKGETLKQVELEDFLKKSNFSTDELQGIIYLSKKDLEDFAVKKIGFFDKDKLNEINKLPLLNVYAMFNNIEISKWLLDNNIKNYVCYKTKNKKEKLISPIQLAIEKNNEPLAILFYETFKCSTIEFATFIKDGKKNKENSYLSKCISNSFELLTKKMIKDLNVQDYYRFELRRYEDLGKTLKTYLPNRLILNSKFYLLKKIIEKGYPIEKDNSHLLSDLANKDFKLEVTPEIYELTKHHIKKDGLRKSCLRNSISSENIKFTKFLIEHFKELEKHIEWDYFIEGCLFSDEKHFELLKEVLNKNIFNEEIYEKFKKRSTCSEYLKDATHHSNKKISDKEKIYYSMFLNYFIECNPNDDEFHKVERLVEFIKEKIDFDINFKIRNPYNNIDFGNIMHFIVNADVIGEKIVDFLIKEGVDIFEKSTSNQSLPGEDGELLNNYRENFLLKKQTLKTTEKNKKQQIRF